MGKARLKTRRNVAPHARSSTRASALSRPARTDQGRLAFPCIEVRLTADVLGKNGARSSARMLKLYRDGTSLAMDANSVRRLFPDGKVSTDTLLRVRFGVPTGPSAQIGNVEALCRILGAKRVGEDLLCVDLKFTTFAENSGGHLERFILDSMAYE